MARGCAPCPLAGTLLLLVAAAAVLPTARAQLRPDNFIANGDTCRSSGYNAGALNDMLRRGSSKACGVVASMARNSRLTR